MARWLQETLRQVTLSCALSGRTGHGSDGYTGALTGLARHPSPDGRRVSGRAEAPRGPAPAQSAGNSSRGHRGITQVAGQDGVAAEVKGTDDLREPEGRITSAPSVGAKGAEGAGICPGGLPGGQAGH